MSFKEVKPEALELNPFSAIGTEWMLITAGDETSCNTMTASWGGLGVLWNKKAATIYIRPQRYTKQFVDAKDTFTLTFFDEAYREALNICGSLSGRDCDKITKAGLTPCYMDSTVAFDEAKLVLVCRKLYKDDLKPEKFIVRECDEKNYPKKDYHTMYIAEVVKAYVKE